MTIRLPKDKQNKIRTTLRQAITDGENRTPRAICKAAQLIGWLLAAVPATRYGQGHFWALENAKKWALVDAHHDYSSVQKLFLFLHHLHARQSKRNKKQSWK
jgi:hypothetical protein